MPEGASEIGKGGAGVQGETRERQRQPWKSFKSMKSFDFLLRSMEVIKELKTGR